MRVKRRKKDSRLRLEMFVDLCHITHNTLPVRPFELAHIVNILKRNSLISDNFVDLNFYYQSRVDSNFFSCGKCQAEVSFLVLRR